MTIKLTTNKALQSVVAAGRAKELLAELAYAEKLAPCDKHVHGAMIQEAVDLLESALELAKQFQTSVNERD